MGEKKHFLRYGTAAEQKYMKLYRHTYNGIAFNGSILAHISKCISAFVHKDINKDFFVDPMTHAFQHELEKISNSKGEIKSSIQKLIDIYKAPINIILDEFRPIKKTDFNDDNLSDFVNNVLDFQNQHITRCLDDEYRDYIEYLEIKKEPCFLIAPYFYLKKNTYDTWNDLNLEMIEISLQKKKQFSGKDIYAQLVIGKDLLLDNKKLEKIIREYSKADGILYWIDGLDETQASLEELRAIKKLIKKYKKKNPDKKIISLYGGYFSELLLKEGLYGVVHGLEYGETRDVIPVGGGIPLSKYYLPALKKRIPAEIMLRLLRHLKIGNTRIFHKDICNCKVCKTYIKNDIDDFEEFIRNKPEPKIIKYKSGRIREIFYPERESKERCLFHYLEVKKNEFETIQKKSKEFLIEELDSAFEKYENSFAADELQYLKDWAEVLRDNA